MTNLSGTPSDDTLNGTSLNDRLSGLAGADTMTGGGGKDTLDGGDGNDRLYGGVGNDVMIGGKGNDRYDVDSAKDVVTEKVGGGHDTVVANVSYILGANTEDLALEGAATDGTGNALDNDIIGTGGDNKLSGAAGNDALFGGLGNDTLLGGDGDDFLSGGVGKDSVIGGRGDDTYLVTDTSDKVTEKAGEGFDTVRTYLAAYILGNDIETLKFDTAAAAVGTGNALANNIHGGAGNDQLDGKAGDDYLYGNGGNDSLLGGVGNDLMHGGTGNDAMTGGTGNDVFRYTLDNTVDLSALGDDTITGFEVGKDKIDILDLFEDFGIVGDPSDYLKLSVDNGNTLVQFDGSSFITLATVQGVTNLTFSDLIFQPEGGPS